MILSDLVITRHPGLGSDPPKRIRPGKGSHTTNLGFDSVEFGIPCDSVSVLGC